jgi:DNA-binding transcriptional ArsR family regulator
VHVLPKGADTWLADRVVHARLAAWCIGAGVAERWVRTEEGLRTATGVAAAVLELERDASRLRWPVTGADIIHADRAAAGVPVDVAELAGRAGVSDDRARVALEALVSAGVAQRRTAHGQSAIAIDGECLVVAPGCAAINWTAVRDALGVLGRPVAAPVAVLRALALRLDGHTAEQGIAELRASVRELADETHYGRTAVADALTALREAGLVDTRVRAGQATRFVVGPAAYGHAPAIRSAPHPSEGMVAVGGSPSAATAPSTHGTRRARRAASREERAGESSDPAAAATIPIRLGDFGGTPILAPAGTPITLEQDASGRWYCRVGTHLRLGPIDGTT